MCFTMHAPERSFRMYTPADRQAPGEFMRFKTLFTFACCFLGLLLVLGKMDARKQRNAAGERGFPQPAPERDVTVSAIPGVIAAGANWKLVWEGRHSADRIVGTKGGGLLFAQAPPGPGG